MSVIGIQSLRPRKFRSKLYIAFTLFTAIISATLTTAYTIDVIKTNHQKATEKAQLLASWMAQGVRLWLLAENIPELKSFAKESASYAGVAGASIYAFDGRLLADAGRLAASSDEDIIGCSMDVMPARIGAGTHPEVGASGKPEKPLGKVYVEIDGSELKATVRWLILKSIFTAIVSWMLTTLLAYRIVGWLTTSLDPLTLGIRTIRGGDYSYRIDTANYDELGETAVAVNELADELQYRESENKRLQKELIDSMKNEVREERRKMMAKLIQTNRMTSLGLLVSSMAHEINTPNGAIKLAGKQVAKTWKDAVPILDQVSKEAGDFSLGGNEYSLVRDEVGKAMDVIIRSSDRIDMVIKDLRAYSLGDRNDQLKDVDVNQVVTDALSIIRAYGRHSSLQIKSDLEQNLPHVHGNRYQLEQVITNLVLNALQAVTPSREGIITITTKLETESKEVLITVQDNGEGISDEIMENIFEPFFSTRMDKGGSGLGLYISNFIANEHGGKIDISSVVGQGTTVLLAIPL